MNFGFCTATARFAVLACCLYAQVFGQADGSGVSFFSMDTFRDFVKAIRPPRASSTSSAMCDLNRTLIEVKNAKAIFLEALRSFVSSVEKRAPLLERDLRYSDVGNAAAEVVSGLRKLHEALRAVEGPLDPKLGQQLRDYWQLRTVLTGRDILRDHKLNTSDLKALADIVTRAESNSALLEQAILDMRVHLKQNFPKCLNQ